MSGTASDPFFWNDWRGDPLLHQCGLASRGFWMEMLALAAESKKKGYILLNGRPPTTAELARAATCTVEEAETCIVELTKNGVASCTRQGIFYSRRMVRDAKKRAGCAKGGKITGRANRDEKRGIFKSMDASMEGTMDGSMAPRRAPLPSPSPSKKEVTSEESEIHSDRGLGSRDDLQAVSPPAANDAKALEKKSSKGCRWEPDAIVTDDWRERAAKKRRDLNLPVIDLDVEAEMFANYWSAKSGAGATKTDWLRTWINWAIKAEGKRYAGREGRPSPHADLVDAGREALAELDRRRGHGG